MCHRVTETHLKDDSLVSYVTSPTMVSLRSNPPKCAVKARPSINNDVFQIYQINLLASPFLKNI